MAGHTNAAQSFWDRAAKKQEAELEKVGYKFSKEEEEERQSMRTVHENMAGSQDAPEFEADGEAAVKVPHSFCLLLRVSFLHGVWCIFCAMLASFF